MRLRTETANCYRIASTLPDDGRPTAMPATAAQRVTEPSMPASLTDTAALRERCKAHLVDVMEKTPAIGFACIGTADGRLFAANDRSTDPQRIAAMASSLLALSESFSKEAMRSRCAYSLIVSEHGAIVIVRIPSKRNHYVLAMGADTTETIALTLRKALDASTHVASILDSAS